MSLYLLTNSFQYLLVLRKAKPAFPCNDLLVNPDRKLAAISRNQIGLYTKFSFEQLRHTGGAGQIVSNDAVAYGNRLHCGNLLCHRIIAKARAKRSDNLVLCLAARRRDEGEEW